MWLIMATGIAAAACENTISLDDVEQRLDGVEISIIKMDFDRILRTQSVLLKDISCLNELLPTELAVRFHQVVGVAYHINDDITKAQQSFATAKLLSNDPLSAQLFPDGHSIYEFYENSPTATRVAVSLPPNNKLYFDGKETIQRPAGGPTLCQQSTESIFRSSYLFPDSSVPFEWFQVAPVMTNPAPSSTVTAPERSATAEKLSRSEKEPLPFNIALLATGATFSAIGVVALVGAWSSYQQYEGWRGNPESIPSGTDLDSTYNSNQALSIVGPVGLGLGLSTIGLSFVF